MKIPKYVLELIIARYNQAIRLHNTCRQLDDWLEKNGIDIDEELADCTRGGVRIMMEPEGARDDVIQAILNATERSSNANT